MERRKPANPTSSSSGHIDGRGPLCQPSPGVSTMASPGPLGVYAKRCGVVDLFKPRVRRRPVRRRQLGGQEPVRIAATCDNARWAGVMWASSLTTWPNSEFRLLVMMSLIQGRLMVSATSVLMKSCQRIPRIIRWQRMWKASGFRKSSYRSAHCPCFQTVQ